MKKGILKHGIKRTVAFISALSLVITSNGFGMAGGGYVKAGELVKLSDKDIDNLYNEVNYKRQSVHDPSIIPDGKGSYYVFGTMMGTAKTNNLMDWDIVVQDEQENSTLYNKPYTEAFKENALKGGTTYYDSNGTAHTVNFGTYNINEWIAPNIIKGNQWAPDVIYNKDMGKWCMYLSLNGNKWNSAIVLLTADNIEGPYTYQAPVVFSGFQSMNNTDTRSFHNTDLELVTGSQSTLPAKYDKGEDWGKLWPHAIDPCVFYDDNGKLWMSYGSWSGGIYMLELDEKTGLRDYSVKYTSDFDSKQGNVTSDEYFGKKIAGGHYVSGEASYIEKIGSKYVLFMSYGFMLASSGGYEMRVFYSDNPDGPYTDTNGVSAIYDRYLMNYSVESVTERGQKIMGNYQWDNMPIGENTQGHNSAYYDEKTGRAYLVYHTRFNDGGEGHQLRVHELFLNEEGFIVASPYEYSANNEKITSATSYAKEKLTGNYDIITHKYKIKCKDHGGETEIVKPEKITLNADGTVSGALTGNWSVKDGTPYATITLGGKEYKGIFAEQNITGTNASTMCFTILDKTTGLCIWGSHEIADNVAVAKNARNFNFIIGEETYNDITLPTDSTDGVTVTWSSSDTSIVSNTGKVTAPQEDTEVILTARFAKGSYYYEKEYRTTIISAGVPADTVSGLEALYKFEGSLENELDSSQKGEFFSGANGTKPFYEYNQDMGSIGLHQYFGFEDAAQNSRSYTKFANPLQGKELKGATVSLWVNRFDTDVFDTLWAFLDEDNSDGTDGRVFFTPNTYFGYNGGSKGWFDCNKANTVTNAISPLAWHLVTVSISEDNFTICVDGIKRYNKNNTAAWASLDNAPYDSFGSKVLELISSAKDFYLGHGSFWGSAPVLMDTLRIYSRKLSEADIAQLYHEELEEIEKAKSEGVADTSEFIYYNDYNNAKNISGTKWTSVSSPERLFLETDITGNKKLYVKYDFNNALNSEKQKYNSRSAYTQFDTSNKLNGLKEYTVRFDTKLPVGSDQESQLALTSSGYKYQGTYNNNEAITGDYIWSLKNGGKNSTNWTINDNTSETVNIPKDKWVNITTKISGNTDILDMPYVPENKADLSLREGLIAEYLFNGNLKDSKTPSKQAEIIAIDDNNRSKYAKDEARGNVMEMRGTWQATGYLKLDKNYVNEINNAFTVTMWAKANNSKTGEDGTCGGFASLFNFKMTKDNWKPNGENNVLTYTPGFVSLDVSLYPWVNDYKGNWVDRKIPNENSTINLSTTKWQQVTMSIDGDKNEILVYVDGTLYDTVSGLGGGTCASLLESIKQNSTEIQIGTWLPWWNYWDFRGYVDDVRLYNRVLTANEIQTLYSMDGDKCVAAMKSQEEMDSLDVPVPAKADITITDIDTNEELYNGSISNIHSTMADGIYVLNGRYDAVSCFDNIRISEKDISSLYNISFEPNGGTGNMEDMLSCNIVQNYRLNANKFTKENYTFAGWSLTPDGDVLYKDEEIVSSLSSENGSTVTLYAVWKTNYTITFNANAPEGAEVTGSMENMSCIAGTEYVLYPNTFKCTGYTFAGWSKDSSATEAAYADKAKINDLTNTAGGNVVLYAIWVKGEIITEPPVVTDPPASTDNPSITEAPGTPSPLMNGLIAEYLFNGNLKDSKNPSKEAKIIAIEDEEQDNQSKIVTDTDRGNVMEMRGTWQATGYLEFDKDYINNIENAFTVTMWAKANNSKTGEAGICGADSSIFNFKTTADNWKEGEGTYTPGFISLDTSLHPWINDYKGNWLDRKKGDEKLNLAADKWQQVTMCIDGTNNQILVYIDGLLSETITGLGDNKTCASLLESIKTNTTAIQAGTFLPWWNTWDFRGYLDDIRMYSRVLTADEIKTLYTVEADKTVIVNIEPPSPSDTEKPTGTGEPTGTGTPSGTGEPTGTGTPSGTGTPAGTGTPSGTGEPAGTGTPSGTGEPAGTGEPSGTETPEEKYTVLYTTEPSSFENAVVSFDRTEVESNGNTVLTVRPRAGYEFKDVDSISVTKVSGVCTIGSQEKNSDGSYSYKISGIGSDCTVKVTAKAVIKGFTVTYSSTVNNATVDVTKDGKVFTSGSNVIITDQIRLSVMPAKGFTFTSAPVVKADNATVNIAEVKDGVYTYVLLTFKGNTDIKISGNTEKVQYKASISDEAQEKAKASNAKLSLSATDVNADSQIQLIVTPDKGFQIKSADITSAGNTCSITGHEKGANGTWIFKLFKFTGDTVIKGITIETVKTQVTEAGTDTAVNIGAANLGGTDFTDKHVSEAIVSAITNKDSINTIIDEETNEELKGSKLEEVIKDVNKAIKESSNVNVFLEVKEETDISDALGDITEEKFLSEVENQALKDTSNNISSSKIAMPLDISLYAKVTGVESRFKISIKDTGSKEMVIDMTVPLHIEKEADGVERLYYMVRFHNGQKTIIPCSYNKASGRIRAKSSKFSTYVLCYVDTSKKEQSIIYNPGYVPSVTVTQTPQTSQTPQASQTPLPSGTPGPGTPGTGIVVPTETPVPQQTPSGNAAVTPAPTAVPWETAIPDNRPETGPKTVKTGNKYTINNLKYTVTSVTGTKAVKFTGASKKVRKIIIPASVKIYGSRYKVTAIAKNALKGNKKLKKLSISTNINKIGKNAFKGCKNLKNIVIKSKKLTVKKTGSNAFKGINKKAKIKVPKGKVKQYKKLVKARGAGKNTKVQKL